MDRPGGLALGANLALEGRFRFVGTSDLREVSEDLDFESDFFAGLFLGFSAKEPISI